VAISEITSEVGVFCVFYFASGSIVTGILHHLFRSLENYRAGDPFWNNQNLIVKDKLKWNHVFGFIVFSMLYFLIQTLAFTTMWTAQKANTNVGIITCIWSINPLFIAVSDYLIYKQKLKFSHAIGTVALVLCVLFISLASNKDDPIVSQGFVFSSKFTDSLALHKSEPLPKWVPIFIGLITPVGFTFNALLFKHLTSPRINFEASTIAFSSYLFVNSIVMVFAIAYWAVAQNFIPRLFWIGLAGSMINTLGIVCA